MRGRTGIAIAATMTMVMLALAAAWQFPASAQTPWVAPAAEKAKKNPVAASPKVVEQGRKVAQVNCVSCHGKGGKGDGPAALALNPKPANWTSKVVQEETDGEIFWKITTGRGPMPPWRHLPESDRWALVHFIRSLQE